MRRLAAAATAAALSFSMAGCGVELRAVVPPPPPAPPPIVDPVDPYVVARPAPALPPANIDPLVPPAGATVVSITFDDGWASQAPAAGVLSDHGMQGTFFVNSGTIGQPRYLSLPQLDALATVGHEIGGHTLTHAHLENLVGDEMRRQICWDREALLGWGFPARSFAYPFGASAPENLDAVRECGYNSGRGLFDLRSKAGDGCDECAGTEGLPSAEPMLTRAASQVENDWTLDDLQKIVTNAGPGWLQLTFHGFCAEQCEPIETRHDVFEEFITWLAVQRDTGAVLVSTVGDAIGGPVQPSVPGPSAAPAPPGGNGVRNAGLEELIDGAPRCWIEGGFGSNTAEFSLVPTTREGELAGRLVLRDHVDGDAKFLQATDLGECAPTVEPGHTYTLSAWYTSTVPTAFSVQYRLRRGIWVYAMASQPFPPSGEFALARWTLPPIPEDVTAISFGLALAQDGELVTDDYALIDENGSPP